MSATARPSLRPPFLARIDGVGAWLAPLGLRTLLAWEFGEAGWQKLHGTNWFADAALPAPFSLLPAAVNWQLATWFELLGAAALLLGIGTRYAAASLWVLTVVAIGTVHWPAGWSTLAELWQGYAITDAGHGNYKLPLLYLAMLLPLVFGGAGRLSVDALLRRPSAPVRADATAWGAVLLAIGMPTALLLPWVGGLLALAGVLLLARPRTA